MQNRFMLYFDYFFILKTFYAEGTFERKKAQEEFALIILQTDES